MIENYMKLARKLSNAFDILLARELFSSIVVNGFEINLIVSLGENTITSIPKNVNNNLSFNIEIIHLFKRRTFKFFLNIY
jgi:hypothetical protein